MRNQNYVILHRELESNEEIHMFRGKSNVLLTDSITTEKQKVNVQVKNK